jgi:hypothetical protein
LKRRRSWNEQRNALPARDISQNPIELKWEHDSSLKIEVH